MRARELRWCGSILVLLGLAAPAHAGEMELLIWGGGKTAAAAQASLKDLEVSRESWRTLIALGQGFPRVIESAKVKGLKPGFHVVAVGVCPAAEAERPLQMFQALNSGLYARAVTWDGAAACPRPDPQGRWEWPELAEVKARGQRLSGLLFRQERSDVFLLLVLSDHRHQALERKRKQNCGDVTNFYGEEGRLVLVEECVTAGGTQPEISRVTTRFSVGANRTIKESQERNVIVEAQYDQ